MDWLLGATNANRLVIGCCHLRFGFWGDRIYLELPSSIMCGLISPHEKYSTLPPLAMAIPDSQTSALRCNTRLRTFVSLGKHYKGYLIRIDLAGNKFRPEVWANM